MDHQGFDELATSVHQAGRIRRGAAPPGRAKEFPPLDVATIRCQIGKSQSAFALMIGVRVATLQSWEQGRRRPEGPAGALLKVAGYDPDAVAAALSR